jgi:pyruvate dehydrogenase (quinone)
MAKPSLKIMPAEMTKGFALYMVKAVMNGRTDEVVNLAPTNFSR